MNDVIEVPVDERPEPRRGAARNAVLGLGLVALVVMGGFLLQALSGGGGGSDSAEGAVRELADSISNEDLLGALAVIAPDEVGSLDRVVNTAFGKAEEYEIVDSAARPFAGFGLQVRDLELESEEMAPGFVKVSMTSGRIDAETHPEQFSELIREQGAPEAGSGSADLHDGWCEEGCPEGAEHPFVMVVETDGRWYVSAAYTGLEYWRLWQGLPAPDLGSARDLAGGGADSPEAAVEGLIDAVSTLDMERIGSLVPPGELGAVYDYRDAIAAAIDEQDDLPSPLFQVEDLEVEATRDGATADVVLTSGTIRVRPDPGEGEGEAQIRFYGEGCMAFDARYETVSTSVSGVTTADGETVDENFFEEVTETEEMHFDTCEEGGAFGPSALLPAVPTEGVPSGLQAVERDGRWYVSLVGTMLRGADQLVEIFDRNTVYSMFGVVDRIEPQGTVAAGGSVDGDLASMFGTDVWSLDGHAGDEIALRVDSEVETTYHFPELYGPDGEVVATDFFMGLPVTLPADGEYRIAVHGYGPYTLHVDEPNLPVLPVPGSVTGTFDPLSFDSFDESGPAVYAVDVPAGAKVGVRAEPGNLGVDAQPAGLDGIMDVYSEYSMDPNAVTLDGSVATRWYVIVWPAFDESMFGPDGEPIGEPSTGPIEFTLTAEVVDGG